MPQTQVPGLKKKQKTPGQHNYRALGRTQKANYPALTEATRYSRFERCPDGLEFRGHSRFREEYKFKHPLAERYGTQTTPKSSSR